MDEFTRRILGFGFHAGGVDGAALCRMFNTAISAQGIPHQLSSDNDPLFRCRRWRVNLRILEIQEIKSVPYTPCSHLFIERLIGTLRREFLDHGFFWNANDLERKLEGYRQYYKANRVQTSKGDVRKSLVRPPAAVPTSADSGGNVIAAGYTSYR
jgi:transposase InsO family protein